MLLNSPRSLFAIAVITIAMVLASCVDIPDKAPDPPAFQSQYRFITVPQNGASNPSSIEVADGPSYSSSRSITVVNGEPTEFVTFLAGSKRVVFKGATPDTFLTTFSTDTRCNMIFYHDSSAAKKLTAQTNLVRYVFQPNGLQDTTFVRFYNLSYNTKMKALSKIDVFRGDSTFQAATLAVNDVSFMSTGTDKVPAGKKKIFYISNYANAARVITDSVIITGASRKSYTVILFDTYDTTAATPAFARLKVVEDF